MLYKKRMEYHTLYKCLCFSVVSKQKYALSLKQPLVMIRAEFETAFRDDSSYIDETAYAGLSCVKS